MLTFAAGREDPRHAHAVADFEIGVQRLQTLDSNLFYHPHHLMPQDDGQLRWRCPAFDLVQAEILINTSPSPGVGLGTSSRLRGAGFDFISPNSFNAIAFIVELQNSGRIENPTYVILKKETGQTVWSYPYTLDTLLQRIVYILPHLLWL